MAHVLVSGLRIVYIMACSRITQFNGYLGQLLDTAS